MTRIKTIPVRVLKIIVLTTVSLEGPYVGLKDGTVVFWDETNSMVARRVLPHRSEVTIFATLQSILSPTLLWTWTTSRIFRKLMHQVWD